MTHSSDDCLHKATSCLVVKISKVAIFAMMSFVETHVDLFDGVYFMVPSVRLGNSLGYA